MITSSICRCGKSEAQSFSSMALLDQINTLPPPFHLPVASARSIKTVVSSVLGSI